MSEIILKISNLIWGIPTLILLIGAGLLLTIRLKGIQFTKFFHAVKLTFFDKSTNAEGDISNLQALMTALAATIGTGNIIGVATAISLGGPGALFWMWVSALIGMASKYGEAVLAVKYREKDEIGEMVGGPMYYIEKGLHAKWLGITFAIFTILASFGIGSGVQGNSISTSLHDTFGIPVYITALCILALSILVVFGGVKCIGKVMVILTPFMIAFFLISCLYGIILNIKLLPHTFMIILSKGFSLDAISGGLIGSAIRYGVARGLYSNEAGLGSSPIAAAAAKTTHPCEQALVSMLQVFIDTIIICSLTGFIIVLSGEYENNYNGAFLTIKSFSKIVGPYAKYIVSISLSLFAFSTILSWSYYGEKSIYYLFGRRSIVPYKIIFLIFASLGAIATNLNMVWNISDIFNGLMCMPNLIALIGLSSVIVSETQNYLNKEK
ncbi:MAG: alanine:cation symporter family protein [Alphaproteobacteria bacterium]|nr:alanine:cation symporter family protein [Alphaproteobacteria bacterium]